MEEEKCEECGGDVKYDSRTSEFVCTVCGLVADIKVLANNEFEDRTRTGDFIGPSNPCLRLCTTTDKRAKMPERLKRAFLSDRITWEEQNVLRAVTEIRRLSHVMSIPKNISVLAAVLYKKLYKFTDLRSHSIEAIASACLFCACRIHRKSILIQDFAQTCDIEPNKLKRSIRFVKDTLNLKIPSADICDIVSELCNRSNFDVEIHNLAVEIAKRYGNAIISKGRNPKSVAAASIYAAFLKSDRKIACKRMAQMLGISVSILKTISDMIIDKMEAST